MPGDIELVRQLVAADRGLAAIAVARPDGTPHVTLVNAGLLAHPVDGEEVIGLVIRAGTAKARYLRTRRHAAVSFRVGWSWATVEGSVELYGPDDPSVALDDDGVRLLLRAVFVGCGGEHEDFDEYDRVMRAERRTAVLLRPSRILTN